MGWYLGGLASPAPGVGMITKFVRVTSEKCTILKDTHASSGEIERAAQGAARTFRGESFHNTSEGLDGGEGGK